MHEGQGWCFAFTLDPLEFTYSDDSCLKGRFEFETSDGRSHFYKDLWYLGHFYEMWRDKDGVRIRYSDARRTPEIELPDGP